MRGEKSGADLGWAGSKLPHRGHNLAFNFDFRGAKKHLFTLVSIGIHKLLSHPRFILHFYCNISTIPDQQPAHEKPIDSPSKAHQQPIKSPSTSRSTPPITTHYHPYHTKPYHIATQAVHHVATQKQLLRRQTLDGSTPTRPSQGLKPLPPPPTCPDSAASSLRYLPMTSQPPPPRPKTTPRRLSRALWTLEPWKT